jgi:type I restriction enzyme S subunit
MKSSYKRLGDYIKEVNKRNTELNDFPLFGVSVKKIFIPSIANTVGTDFSKYKIVKRNQFTYIPDTSRRGEKIGLAFLESHDEALVSQAYTVFKVIDENELLPEYLMMWFRRTEFDRYARVKSHGSVREIFDWGEMCDIELPMPSIEKQREIVKEYNVIQNRITLNTQLIAKLEETAQTIYKQWFVDFEFPDQNGLPYKSNGGAMEWCEELEKDVPSGWELVNIETVSDKLYGYPFDSNLFTYEQFDNIQLIRIRDILSCKSDVYTSQIVDKKFLIKDEDLLIGMDGKFHIVLWFGDRAVLNQRVVRFRTSNKDKINNYQILLSIKKQIEDFEKNIFGTTVAHLSDKNIKEIKFLIADNLIQSNISLMLNAIIKQYVNKEKQNLKLGELKDLLLARMTKVESEIETVEN